MYLVEINNKADRKWTRRAVSFADLEEAERYAMGLVQSGEAVNARVVDEKYRRSGRGRFNV